MTVKDTFNSLGDGFRNAYGICDLRVKVRITNSSWHDLIHGLPEAAQNFTFWWNSENAKIGKFSMNGNALSCRADQVDDYDVHMTYAIKM